MYTSRDGPDPAPQQRHPCAHLAVVVAAALAKRLPQFGEGSRAKTGLAIERVALEYLCMRVHTRAVQTCRCILRNDSD